MRRSLIISAAMVLLILVTGSPWLRAQDQSKGQASGKSASISDKELQSFAKTYVRFHQIRQKYAPALKGAQSREDRDRIQAEAEARVTNALKESGLTREGYNRLYDTINSDPELRKKALELIGKERKQS